ncbi:MAG: conjugative transfer protein MobI(A/C) [Rhodanobacter sp.]|jgi:hypothetical protein
MTHEHNDPRAVAAMLYADTLALREMFVSMAQALCDEYLSQRAELQQRSIQATARHVGVETKLARHYAPLLLRTRKHKGSNELYWCKVNHGRYRFGLEPRRTHLRYLARGKRLDLSYSLPSLLKHARAWELDLVIDIETRAARLRRSFREISKIAALLHTLQRLADSPSRSAASGGNRSPAAAQPDEASPPGIMPTPPPLRQSRGDAGV